MTYRNDDIRAAYGQVDDRMGQLAEFMSDPRQIVLSFSGAASGNHSFYPGRKTQILDIRMTNGEVAQAAATHTTVFDIDSEDGAGTKVADVAANVATVVVADAILAMTMSGTAANLILEATETLKCARTIVGTQSGCALTIDYKFVD